MPQCPRIQAAAWSGAAEVIGIVDSDGCYPLNPEPM